MGASPSAAVMTKTGRGAIGGCEVEEVELLLVVADLAGERDAAGAGERGEVVVLAQLFCFICRSGGLAARLTAVCEAATDVPGGDENGTTDLRVVRDGRGSHVSAHAVADDDDAVRIDAVLLIVGGVEQELHLGVGILGGVCEGEVAFDAPRTAIVHGEDVPAVSAEGLRDVEVLLEAGEAVKDDGGGVRAGASGEIEDAEEIAAVAGQNGLLGCGRCR